MFACVSVCARVLKCVSFSLYSAVSGVLSTVVGRLQQVLNLDVKQILKKKKNLAKKKWFLTARHV